MIRKCIRERRQHLEEGLAAAKSLGIPIRKRGDPPKAFSFPIKPREIPLVKAKGEKPSVPPNPILEKAIYENILEVCLSMSLVMERNPSTFSSFGEEPIRDLFLVVLNAFFQGGATGETFNRGGKTDILVRHQNKNLFIAECKLWKGESELLKAINQLLIYDTWRDPHNAIFIFNTDVKISTIHSKIDEIVKKHPNCKKPFGYDSPSLKSEKGIRGYLFSHPSDTGSEIQITFMIFDIPKSGQ